MPNFLAIETSTDRLSLGLSCRGEVRVVDEVVGQRHAERALDAIDRLLSEAGVVRTSLDGVAFGAGPGSFTGLRIACGIAQGLAMALGVPVLGIGTLEALAETVGARRVAGCIDARMNEVYFAAYEQGEVWRTIVPVQVCRPDLVPIPEGEGWFGAGNGFSVYCEQMAARLGATLSQVDAGIFPSAAALLRLAAPRFGSGEGISADAAMPLYIRDKVALKTSERT